MASFDREQFDAAALMAGSHNRAAVLATLGQYELDAETLREILAYQWPMVDGSREHTDAILDIFLQAGYTTDEPGFAFETDEDGDVQIFRGNVGEDPRLGFSWTLDRAVAERFASAPFSLRHQVLGIAAHRLDGEEPWATVWGSWVYEADILGYFNGRSEQEVIVSGSSVSEPVKVAEAVRDVG